MVSCGRRQKVCVFFSDEHVCGAEDSSPNSPRIGWDLAQNRKNSREPRFKARLMGATVADAAGNEVALDATEDIDFALALLKELLVPPKQQHSPLPLMQMRPESPLVQQRRSKPERRAIMQEEILSMAAVGGGADQVEDGFGKMIPFAVKVGSLLYVKKWASKVW